MKLSTRPYSIVLALALAGCAGTEANQSKDEGDASGNEKEGTTNQAVDEDVPADSTGATGQVGLGFGAAAAALALQDGEAPTATSLKVSDTISLTIARFNIAAIKVKATKEPSAKESENDAKAVEEEKADVQEVEAATDDAGAGLSEKAPDQKTDTGPATKEKRQARKDKVVAAKDKLGEKAKSRSEAQAGRDKGIRFKGPYVFDAIAGVIEGEMPPVDLVDGSYRRIDFQLKRSFDAAADDPLLGNVFVIHGEFTKADQSVVPFAIEWHVAMNFRLKAEDAFSVVAGGENKLNIAFDVAKWFDGVSLEAASVDADGTMYINKQSNRELLKAMHKNLKIHTHFGKDKDGDGKLAPSEQQGAGEDTVDASAE